MTEEEKKVSAAAVTWESRLTDAITLRAKAIIRLEKARARAYAESENDELAKVGEALQSIEAEFADVVSADWQYLMARDVLRDAS